VDLLAENEDVAIKLAWMKPSAGVIDAFTDLERQALRYLSLSDLPQRGSPVLMFSRDPHVPKRLKNIIRELSQLRNAAVHGHCEISKESALEYITTVRHVTNELTNLENNTERNL